MSFVGCPDIGIDLEPGTLGELCLLVDVAMHNARRKYSFEMVMDPRRPWRRYYRQKLAEEKKKVIAWADYHATRIMRENNL